MGFDEADRSPPSSSLHRAKLRPSKSSGSDFGDGTGAYEWGEGQGRDQMVTRRCREGVV